MSRRTENKELITSITFIKKRICELLKDRLFIKDFTLKIIPLLYEIDDYSKNINVDVLQRTDLHKMFKNLFQLPESCFMVKEICSDVFNNVVMNLKKELFYSRQFYKDVVGLCGDAIHFDFDKEMFMDEINEMIKQNEKRKVMKECVIRTDGKYLEIVKKMENGLLIEAKRRQKMKEDEMERFGFGIESEKEDNDECKRDVMCKDDDNDNGKEEMFLNKKRNECNYCSNNSNSSNVNVDVCINSKDDGKEYNNNSTTKKNNNEIGNTCGDDKDDKDVMVVICLNESNEVNEKETKRAHKKKHRRYKINNNTNIGVLKLRNTKTPIKHVKRLRNKFPKHKTNKEIFTIKATPPNTFQSQTLAKFIITTTS